MNGTIDMGAFEFDESALPVQLVRFTGVLQNREATLSWLTATESGFSYFELQQASQIKAALDGQKRSLTDWKSLGSIKAQGSNSHYNYTATQMEATAYYRLKMVDDEGHYIFSDVVALSQKESRLLTLYPNPTKDYIHVKANESGILRIYDGAGRLLQTAALVNGINNIDVRSLRAGIYYGEVKCTRVKFVK